MNCLKCAGVTHSSLIKKATAQGTQASAADDVLSVDDVRVFSLQLVSFSATWLVAVETTIAEVLIRRYHTAVFISAHISSPSVNNCPRRS